MLNAIGVSYGAVDYIIKHLGSLTLNQLIQLERINPRPDMPKGGAGLALVFDWLGAIDATQLGSRSAVACLEELFADTSVVRTFECF
ncbi:MAG: hypothetical protein OSB69_12655, partial [Alphaproteobacteria bacterium]|nr:hypothetical protein [Alphaproteobacteria bacterium]